MHSPSSSTSLGLPLARICEQCPHLSDEVLDLHLGMQRRCLPGTCAKALFRISQEARHTLNEEVTTLFSVIPKALAVEARGPDGHVIEQVPFEPDPAENLETYCQRMMNQFFWDRNLEGSPLRLQFCYA